jgi:hypothetical protein
MMRNMDREPALPPAARARAERNAARRARRRGGTGPEPFLTRRFVIRSLIISFLIGFLAFSLRWPDMPVAAYIGLAVGGAVLILLAGFRALRRRRGPAPPSD